KLAPRNSCAWARCLRSIIRMSSSTWGMPAKSSVLIARRCSVTISASTPMRPGRPNARCRSRLPPEDYAGEASLVASSRTVIIAGAGIGGLTAALALARQGLRIALLDQAQQLEEVGAGIQLSPNASRVLIELGLRDRLTPLVVRPEQLRVMNARSGRVLS